MTISQTIKRVSNDIDLIFRTHKAHGANREAVAALDSATAPLREIQGPTWEAAQSLLADAHFYYSEQAQRVPIPERIMEEMRRKLVLIRLQASAFQARGQ
ncbi:MAG: hypothetical protein VB141_11255 [Burkholderia gladioli]